MNTHYSTFQQDPKEAELDTRLDVIEDLKTLIQLITDGSIGLVDVEREMKGIASRITKAVEPYDPLKAS
jgi:hypothetical protein